MVAPAAAAHPRVLKPSGFIQAGGATAVVGSAPAAAAHPRVFNPPPSTAHATATVTSAPTAAAHPRVFRGTQGTIQSSGVTAGVNVIAVTATATALINPPSVKISVPRVGRVITVPGRGGTTARTASAVGEDVSLTAATEEDLTLAGRGGGSDFLPAPSDAVVNAVTATATAKVNPPSIASAVTITAVTATATALVNPPTVTGGTGSTIDIAPGTDIQGVIDANPSGSVYRLLAGTHRLTNGGSLGTTGIFLKPGDTIFGEKDASGNWLTNLYGSVQLSNWVQDGSYWRHENVTQRTHDNFSGNGKLSWSAGTRSEILHVDGGTMFPQNTQAKVLTNTPFTDPWFSWPYEGSFYFDTSANRLWIAIDPAGRTFEFSYVARAFQGTADNLTIRDLNIEFFACREQQSAVSLISSSNLTFTGNRCAHASGSNFWCGANSYVADNEFLYAGQINVKQVGNNTTFEYNEVAYGNLLGFNNFWEAGGFKPVDHTGVIIRGNYVHNNHGRGIWPDIDNRRYIIEYNYSFNNAHNGIADETNVGSRYVNEADLMSYFRYNVCIANGWQQPDWAWGAQINIQNARAHKIHDNYCETGVGGTDTITLITQTRTWPFPPYPTENNEIYDNTLVYAANGGQTGIAGDTFLDGFNMMDPGVNNFHDNDYFAPSGYTSSGNHWKGRNHITFQGDDINYAEWLSQGRGTGSTTTVGSPTRRVTLSGTATSSITETDITNGGKVLTLTWEDRTDFWSPRLGSDPTVTQDFIDNGFSGDLGEFAEVAALLTIQDFNRVDHKTLSITFPATASYNIVSLETVTLTIPNSACVRSSDLTAGTFTITQV